MQKGSKVRFRSSSLSYPDQNWKRFIVVPFKFLVQMKTFNLKRLFRKTKIFGKLENLGFAKKSFYFESFHLMKKFEGHYDKWLQILVRIGQTRTSETHF